jgi:hypothetical protein
VVNIVVYDDQYRLNHKGVTLSCASIAAIGVVAWIVFAVLHEVVGHALVASLLGEQVNAVSTVTAHIDDFYEIDNVAARIGAWGFRLVCAGGALVNLLSAGFALLLLASARIQDSAVRYFLWLFSSICIVQQSFWITVQPFAGLGGDWVAFLNGLEPLIAWKAGLTGTGLMLFILGVWLPTKVWQPNFTSDRATVRSSVKRLTIIPILVSFAVQLLSMQWLPLTWSRYGVLFAIATFLPLVIWIFAVNRMSLPENSRATFRLPLAPGWIVVALVLIALFVVWLGPGIGSFEGHPQFSG